MSCAIGSLPRGLSHSNEQLLQTAPIYKRKAEDYTLIKEYRPLLLRINLPLAQDQRSLKPIFIAVLQNTNHENFILNSRAEWLPVLTG